MKILEISDFDKDGRDEVLIETEVHNAYFKPSAGGTLFEYDYKAADKNLLDTMPRREEGYHEKLYHAKIAGEDHGGDGTASIHDLVIAKEPGLEKYLVYDKYERKSFVDHIIENTVTPEQFMKNAYEEKGTFITADYTLEKSEVLADSVKIILSKDGSVLKNSRYFPLKITKEITVFKNTELIEAQYKLANLSDEKLNFRFAVEFNYGLQAGHADDRFYYNPDGRLHDSFLDSIGVVEGSQFLGLKDEYMKIDINISAEKADAIWRLPVETISLSEAGFEKVYQSSCVLLIWDVDLQDEKILKINQKVSSL
jgi:alpha-amylase